MENIEFRKFNELKKSYIAKIKEIDAQMAIFKTNLLQEKAKCRKKELKIINEEYINVFGSNQRLINLLFNRIDEQSFYFSHGLTSKLKDLGIFYIWQIVLKSEEYYNQKEALGLKLTSRLKKDLKEKGLYLGMKLY